MAAPEIRGRTLPASGGIAITSPATTKVGDLVIVWGFERAAAGIPTFTAANGFTFATNGNISHNDGSTDGRFVVAYYVATTAGAVSYSAFTTSGAASGVTVGMEVLVGGTFDTGTIVAAGISDVGVNPPDPPSVSLNTSRAFRVYAAGAWHLTAAQSNTVTVVSGYSDLSQVAVSSTADLAICHKAVGPSVASEDPGAFGDNQTPNGTVALTFAIGEPLRNTTVTNNADGGTHGTVVTYGNSGGASGSPFNNSSFYGDTVTFDRERSVSGLSYKSVKNSATASALGWNDWTLASGGEMFGRMYINLGALPTLNSYIMNAYNAGTYLAGIRLDTDGELHLYDQNSALLDTSNFMLALDKWYRLEFRLKTAGQEFELRIYEGHSTTPLDTLLSTGQDLGAVDMNGVVFGWSSGSNFNGTMWFGDVGISSAWMGASQTSYAKVYDFENGTDEATVVATDPTGTDNDAEEVDLSGSPSVMVYDTAVAARGTKSARFSNGATSGTARWEWPTTNRRLYVRAYVYLRSGHSDTLELIRFAGTGGARVAAIRVTAARKLVGVDSTAATGTASTLTLAEQTWYRIEACFDHDSQTIEWRVYTGANLHTTTADETMAPYVGSLQTQGTPTQVFFGQATGAASFGPTWMDEIAASNNNWIGPAADLGTPITGNDSAAGSETAALAVALTATDSANASDASSLDVGTVSKSGTDSATGSDTSALVVALTASDSASGSDTSDLETPGGSTPPTATVKVAATGDTTNATNWNTTSWTPTADRVYYLFASISEVSELETGNFTVTGNGLTWTLVNGTPFDFGTVYSDRIELFRADNTAGSGTAGVTNISTADGVNHDGCLYCIIEVENDGGVLESNAAESSADGASISIASYATDSLVLAGIAKSGNETVAPSGETELSEGSYGTPARVMQVQSGTDTTSTWAAWGLGRAYGAVIVEIGAGGGPPPPTPTFTQSHFRIRSDDTVALNTDSGWAAALDTNATIDAEKIFRVRFEVETPDTFGAKTFKLQYRRNAGTWTDLAKPGGTGPAFTEAYAVEMRDSTMFANDAATTNLLAGSSLTFDAGAGVTDNLTPSITLTNEHTEYEFPLLIRISYGYSSGTIGRNHDGDTFELRLVESSGAVLGGTYVNPTITLNVPDRLIGGTIVETPRRTGPMADANGNLYYLCEYAEPAPYKLMLKSTDGGDQWTEPDAANAPGIRDLESVDCQVVGHTIHVMHMGLGAAIYYSTFNMSSHGSAPDTWVIKDQLVHDTAVAPQDQSASLVVRGDGTVIAAYNTDPSGTAQQQGYRIRSAGGTWSAETILDAAGGTADFTDVCMVLGASNKTHIFYQDLTNGILYHRSLTSADVLSARETVVTGLSTAGGREHVIIPPVYYDDAGAETIVVGYTKNGDIFYTNSVINDGTPGTEQQVTATALATNIGSSDHAAAFIANDGTTLHAFWADDVTFDLWHTENLDLAGWTSTTEILDNTQVDLVTGTIFTHNGGNGGAKVAGMVFDGSTGYTGNQQYVEYVLSSSTPKTGTDSATGSETSHIGLSSTESGTGSDTATVTKYVTESGTGSETSVVTKYVTESGVGSDTAVVTSPVAASDTGVGTDTAALAAALSGTDSGAGSDASSLAQAKTASESGIGTDTAALVVALTATETGTGTDAGTLAQPKTASDTGVGTDTVSALTVTLSATDAGAGSETSSVGLARTDSGSGSDASSLAAAASATESGTGSEVSGLGLVGSEAGIGADTSSLAASLAATDSGTGSETSALGLARTETGVGTDTATLAVALAASDSATGIETSGLLAGDQRSANDSGTATDTAVLAAALTASDSASGAETSALTQAKTASDSGVGTDTATVSVPKTASETGTGTDTAVLAVALAATESGVGTDTSNLLTGFIVNASDTGTGADTAVLAAGLVATDAGVGSELAQIGLARTETGTGAETASVALSGADSGTGAEASTVGLARTEAGSSVETSTLAAAVGATDSGIGTESATSAHVGSDSATGSDTSALTAAVSASESGALSQETANVGEGNNKSASDVGNATDTAVMVVALSSTETGAGVETSSLGEQTFINVTDSGSATETSRISLVAADSGSGTETATPAAALSASETGAGVDTALLVAALARTDAALGTDAALLAAALTRSDTGVGTDTSARAVVITALEIGSGADTAALSVVIVATDSALAFDVVMEVDRADASLGSNLEARHAPEVLLDARVTDVRHTGTFRPEVELDGSWGSRRDPGGWMSTSLFGSEYAESHA